ncbi:MAG: hypothetical protein ACR2NP_00645 [Pirellulaceae bacterium]
MVDHREPAPQTEPERPEFPWSRRMRFWVSLLLLGHLFCLVITPLAAVEPRSQLSVDLHRVIQPYCQALYLEHGYRFFAPEPGPSHIVQYRVTDQSGEIITGQFPDRDQIWPRLLYHRWFMLSETTFRHVAETLGDEELESRVQEMREEISDLLEQGNPRAAEELEFQLQRNLQDQALMTEMRDRLVADVGQMLMDRYNGVSVQLRMLTRVIPPPADIARGIPLDDPRFLPEDLSVDLGTINTGSSEIETIEPQESVGQGGGEPSN